MEEMLLLCLLSLSLLPCQKSCSAAEGYGAIHTPLKVGSNSHIPGVQLHQELIEQEVQQLRRAQQEPIFSPQSLFADGQTQQQWGQSRGQLPELIWLFLGVSGILGFARYFRFCQVLFSGIWYLCFAWYCLREERRLNSSCSLSSSRKESLSRTFKGQKEHSFSDLISLPFSKLQQSPWCK